MKGAMSVCEKSSESAECASSRLPLLGIDADQTNLRTVDEGIQLTQSFSAIASLDHHRGFDKARHRERSRSGLVDRLGEGAALWLVLKNDEQG
jgi:hypothetical protein